jgi:hypothetical protein
MAKKKSAAAEMAEQLDKLKAIIRQGSKDFERAAKLTKELAKTIEQANKNVGDKKKP